MTQTSQPPIGSSSPVGRPGVFDVQGFIRKYIPFSSRFLGNQKSGMGEYLSATFANANANTAFTIAVGRIPSVFVQLGATVGGIVFAPSTAAWTPNSITLQATVAGTYRLWVY